MRATFESLFLVLAWNCVLFVIAFDRHYRVHVDSYIVHCYPQRPKEEWLRESFLGTRIQPRAEAGFTQSSRLNY